MTKKQQQLCTLLRLAIEDRKLTEKERNLFSADVDWQGLYTLARKQAVIGIAAYGLERLMAYPSPQTHDKDKTHEETGSDAWGIPKAVFFNWMGLEYRLQTKNEHADEACRKLTAEFEAMGCRTVILKGQSVAKLYRSLSPAPNIKGGILQQYRTTGDIDVWAVKWNLRKQEIKKAGNSRLDASRYVMAKLAMEKKPDGELQPHHIDYPKKDGINVELHFFPYPICNLFFYRRATKYFEDAITDRYDEFPDVGGFRKLPLDVDIVFQLIHLRGHLIGEGVGLRQVLDLYFTLIAFNKPDDDTAKNIDSEELLKTIDQLGLRSFAGAMMWVIGQVIGTETSSWMICAPDEKRGRFVLDEIFKGGNFGRFNEDKGSDGNTKLSHLVFHAKEALRCVRYFPNESLWNPIYRIYVGLWRKGFLKEISQND